MTVPVEQRAEMLEVALRMIDNLLDHPMTPTAQKNAQEIIRHALREATSQ